MKNRSSIALALAVILTLCGQAEENKPEPKSRTVKTSLDFSKHLDGEAKWKLREAGILSLRMDGDSTIFLQNGEEVFRLNAPEYIDEAILSEDGSALMLVAMQSRGYGSDYATLIRVQTSADKLKFSRVLPTDQKIFEEQQWWLSELGAISNDSATVLAKFGVMSSNGSHRMGYKWYTVEVITGKIVGEGLTMANSKPSINK